MVCVIYNSKAKKCLILIVKASSPMMAASSVCSWVDSVRDTDEGILLSGRYNYWLIVLLVDSINKQTGITF